MAQRRGAGQCSTAQRRGSIAIVAMLAPAIALMAFP
jgi:hypothetical protein